MSKKKRTKRKGGKIPPRPPKIPGLPKAPSSHSPEVTPKKPWFRTRWFVSSAIALIGVGGSFATFYGLSPSLSISPTALLAPRNALSTQFEMVNAGYLDAKNIGISIGGVGFDGPMSFLGNSYNRAGPERLRRGEKATVALNTMINAGRTPYNADVVFDLSYNIPFLPRKMTFHSKQRWVTVTNYEGAIVWNAMSEK